MRTPREEGRVSETHGDKEGCALTVGIHERGPPAGLACERTLCSSLSTPCFLPLSRSALSRLSPDIFHGDPGSRGPRSIYSPNRVTLLPCTCRRRVDTEPWNIPNFNYPVPSRGYRFNFRGSRTPRGTRDRSGTPGRCNPFTRHRSRTWMRERLSNGVTTIIGKI